jgi:hypothetical protein
MDEEEELDNTLIGQEEEEAPAVNTGDALIGKPSFLPYAEDVAPSRVNALSVFTPGGDLKPGMDVNAITPAPTTLPAPSDVSTALNQEVPIDPVNNKPGFLYNTFVNAPVQADQRATEFMSNLGEKISTGYNNLLGSAMRNLTPVEELGYTPEPFGKTFTDTFSITRPDGTKFYPDEVTSPAVTQASTAATQFLTPDPLVLPSETIGQAPSVNAFSAESAEQVNPMMRPLTQDQSNAIPAPLPEGVQKGSPQANFLNTLRESDGNLTEQQISQFRQDAQDMGTTFDPVTGFSRDPFLSREASRTSTPMPGQTLSQFLRYEDSPKQRTEQFVDPQGRLRRRLTPQASALQELDSGVQPLAPEFTDFERDSLARQQRIGGTGSFTGDSAAREARIAEGDRLPGETQAERDTRIAQSRTTGGQTEGLSFDDARRRAEGELAERGVRNPSASQVNALARLKQAEEPERLAELETQRAKDAAELRDAEAKKDFKPQIVEIGDQRLIQLAPEYYQPIRPEPKEDEIFEPRILEHNGFVYYEIRPNSFERQPATDQTREELLAEIRQRNEVMGATPSEGNAEGDKKLDKETAQAILNEAGGDKEEARRIARERGFVL